jgi:hypothetical protein
VARKSLRDSDPFEEQDGDGMILTTLKLQLRVMESTVLNVSVKKFTKNLPSFKY